MSSTETRKMQLAIEADATGAKQGFEQVKAGARDMAQEVAKSGATAAQGLAGIGEEGRKLNAGQQRIIDSLRRTTILTTEGKAAYLEQRAAMAGVSAEAAPYIAKLKLAEQGTAQLGLSAKATAAAMRGIPAQFTDIITSLQAGQNPMTVLLQQGGQLKDMFGGAGNAAKALGGYVLGLINPITVAAAVVGTMAIAAHAGSRELRDLEAASILSGNAAGLSVSQYGALRDNLAGIAGTKGKAAEALTEIARSGGLAGANVQAITEAAILLEKAGGQAIAKTVQQFASLSDAPLKAAVELNKGINFLTASTYAQIKALEEQGRSTDAARVAEDAYAQALKTRAESVIASAGTIEKAWTGVTGWAKKAWDAMLGVGRDLSLSEKLASAAADVARIQQQIKGVGTFGETGGGAATGGASAARKAALEAELATAKQLMAAAQRRVEIEQQNAGALAEQQRLLAANVEWDKVADTYASKKLTMAKEIEAATQKAIAAGRTQAELDQVILEIRKKYKEQRNTDGDAYAAIAAGIGKEIEASTQALEVGKELAAHDKFRIDTLAKLDEALRKNQITVAQAIELESQMHDAEMKRLGVEQMLAKTRASQAEYADYIRSEVELNAAYVAASKAREQGRQAVLDYGQAIDEQNALTQLELSLVGATQAARDVAIGQYRIQLDLKKQLKAIDQNAGFDEPQREEQRALTREAAARASAGLTARAYVDEWRKTSDQISQSLTDALMRGFENGKGFAKNLRDSVVNMFKTMVLKPVVSAIVSPVAQGITGALGFSGAAQAGQGAVGSMAGSALGSITLAGSSIAAIGSSVGTGIMATLSGQSIGAAASAYSAAGMGGVSTGLSVGSAMPHVAAALIAAKMLEGGETRSGATYDTVNGRANFQQGPSGGEIQGDAARALFDSTLTTLNDTLKALGSKAVVTGFTAGLESSDNGKGFEFAGGFVDGRAFGESGGRTGGQFKMESQDAKTAFADYGRELSQSILEALQVTTDIPATIREQLAGVDIKSMSGEAVNALLTQITAVAQFTSALNQLPFEGLKNLSFDAAAGLAKASGGVDQLGANLSAYFERFYTGAEKTAQLTEATAAAFEQLGITMPAMDESARAWYRSEVERLGAMDLSIEANANAYAGILALGGAVDQLAPAFDGATASAGGLLQRLREDGANLQDELDRLTLSRGAYREQQIATYSPEEQTAARANFTLADRIDEIEANRRLQDQLDLLTGAQTERTIALRDATAESTRALLEQIYAQEDLKASLEASTAAAIEATQGAMDAMIATFGDLAGAMIEMDAPALTLVDAWRNTRAELDGLTRGLAEALGQLPPPTALDNLRGTLSALSSAARGMDAINRQIYDLQTGSGDSAAIDLMRQREAALFAELATSADPGQVAADLSATMLRRISAEAELASRSLDDVARLEQDAREAQIKGLQDQISAAERLVDFTQSLKGFVAELQFSELSALNPQDQLAAARANFESLFALAGSGDANAQANLQGAASAYLQEAQGFFGGATSQYADIFGGVIDRLDGLSMTPVSDTALMTDQLAALQSIEASSEAAASTTREQITALESIRAALAAREAELAAQAESERAAVQAQLDLLRNTVANQEAQIRQQAEIYNGLSAQLKEQTDALDRLATAAETEAAAP